MIRQYVELRYWRWRLWIWYSAPDIWADEILDALWAIGCRGEDWEQAQRNLRSGRLDQGLCYSNYQCRCSVMVISQTSEPKQFMNSLLHEMRHLERHIEQALDIDPWGEESAYLAGKIGELTFDRAKLFMCHCYDH